MTAVPVELGVAAETVHTHCPFCALNCGLTLEIEHGSITGSSRWPDAPLTRGGLCVKGRAAHEQVHHRERLTKPLVRRNGDFTETTWDDALDRVAHGFRRIAAEHGVDANAVLSGGSLTNEKVYLVGKFARVALGTRHVDYNGRFCMTSAGAANKLAFGADRMMTPLDELGRAEAVVVVGANLSAAFPVRVPKLIDGVRRRGGRVVVVDPRRSRFVKPGDVHVALRPATDAAFFGGVMREVIEQGLIDVDFLSERTTGFEDVLREVQPLTPDVVGDLCDIEPAQVVEVARIVGSTRRAMWLHGRGPEQQVGGTANVLAIINVGLACGHVGRPGTGINMLTGQRNGQGGREWGQRCDQLPAGRTIEDPDDRRVVAAHWGISADELPGAGSTYVEILKMAEEGSIRGLLAVCTNMAVSAPRLDAIERRLAALEHLVVVDPFFSESARHAHVVLPGTTFAEEAGTITTLEGRVVRVDQAVEPAAGRSDLEVLRGLAARLGAADHFRFEHPREVYEEMRVVSAGGPVDYAGITWGRLRDEDGVFWPCPDEDHPGTPQLYTEVFAHADGRARFHAVLPPVPPLVADAAYPVVLTTGRVLDQFLSGNQTRRMPTLADRTPSSVLEVHPDTALAFDLRLGESVQITSRLATVEVAWAPNPSLRPDTVFLPYHWPVCNRLVDEHLDPISRIPGFKYTPVTLAPAATVLDVADSEPERQFMGS
ncbi:MAG: molybdopterin oxidoreductase family protein [Actinomycetota bacterium]